MTDNTSISPPTNKKAYCLAIAKRLRQFRKEHLGMNHSQICPYFACGRANYSRIEKGEVFPSITALINLYREFNLSLYWILLGEGDMLVDKTVRITSQAYKSPEIADMLELMMMFPPLRHFMINQFQEYKHSKKQLIEQYFKQHNTGPGGGYPGS